MDICSRCTQTFESEELYLTHTCPTTGFTPTQPEHLGEEFLRVSQEAVQRGEERKAQEVVPEAPSEAVAPVELPIIEAVVVTEPIVEGVPTE